MFPGKAEISAEALRGKLAVLLRWGIRCYHVQPHRPYLTAALVRHMHTLKTSDLSWIEPYLMTWIDQASETTEEDLALAAEVLSSELFNNATLRFDVYLQHMIALGRTSRQSSSTNSVNRYLAFVTRLQVIDLPQALVTLRENITIGFGHDTQTKPDNSKIRQALDRYLNQSQGVRRSHNLFGLTLDEVPKILLEMDTPSVFTHCRQRLSEFSASSSAAPLDFALRLSLFIHLLESQQNYRLLLDLLAVQWRLYGNSVSKPVADAVKRHHLLISSFEEQHPDLCIALSAHAKGSVFTGDGRPIILVGPQLLQQQIRDLHPYLSMIDYQTLENLHLARASSLTTDSVSTLWTISVEMASRLDVKAKPNVISVIANLWTAIIRSSWKAWKTHLRHWVVDANPTSSIYAGTSALFLELLLRGAIEWGLVWQKLIQPFISSPAQANINRFYLQPMALVCVCLLPTDDKPIGTAHDLLLHSAITTDFTGLIADEASASSVLQRLPSVLLLMLDENSPAGISTRIRSIVNSPHTQSVAMRYEAKVKESFFAAIADVPERRIFLQLLLDMLLGKPGNGK